MSDFKNISVQELCKEYPYLDVYIHRLQEKIKHYEEGTSTVYSPNKPSYKELVEKVNNLETTKQKEIDELKTLNRSTEQRIAEYIEDKTSLNREIQQLKQSLLNLTNDVFDLRRKNKLLCSVIDFAVGYISATQPHTDKHPMEVKRWLFEGFERMKDEI